MNPPQRIITLTAVIAILAITLATPIFYHTQMEKTCEQAIRNAISQPY